MSHSGGIEYCARRGGPCTCGTGPCAQAARITTTIRVKRDVLVDVQRLWMEAAVAAIREGKNVYVATVVADGIVKEFKERFE